MKQKLFLFGVIRVFAIAILACTLLVSCVSLKAPIVNKYQSLDDYKYFYITPTSELTSSSAAIYGGYGAAQTNSLNPTDVISGIMLKNGFVRLSELNPDLLEQTLIVNYGESGKRSVSLGLGYTLEVTIQMLSAKTNSIVCLCVAEGIGSTETDDIRTAINRALTALFK